MKNKLCRMILLITMILMLTACNNAVQTDDGVMTDNTKATTEGYKEYAMQMLPEELESVEVGELSSDHIYYNEVVTYDSACTDYIQEITIYDKEIDDNFLVHVSLPPNYDVTKRYPVVVMTDGVWRLSDHVELRPLMTSGKIEELILVSIGYPNDYDYRKIRERDLVKDPKSYLHFVVDNLVPYLKDNYAVDEDNMTLTGHSYGGYWGFYALFNHDTIGKGTFQNYYIGSPSFQAHTNCNFISDYEEEYYEHSQELNCNVYVTVGSKENDSFVAPIERFMEKMNARNYSGLNLTYEEIEGHSHDTVFKPSIKNTLKLFYGVN